MTWSTDPPLGGMGVARPGWSPDLAEGRHPAALRGLIAIAVLGALALLVSTSLLAAPDSRSLEQVKPRVAPAAKSSVPGDPHC